ncbi:MAG: chorismate synthase [Thermoplasmatota archaeon]
MNQFGQRFRLSLFGESHGQGVGVTVDGVPAGLPFDLATVQADLDARRPGRNILVTQRQEPDQAEILAGVFRDHTTGAPLTLWIANQDQQSNAYRDLDVRPRPGHSDWVAGVRSKGHNDFRGGGHYSGRLTAGLVSAGAVAQMLLDEVGITVAAHLHQVADLAGPDHAHDVAALLEAVPKSMVYTGHRDLEGPFVAAIDQARRDKDSLGGIVEFVAEGLPVALGDPFFDSVESLLAHILFAVPAVKGVDFGDGFASVALAGSEHNDPYAVDDAGHVHPTTNHAGGILGGLTTGAPLRGRVAIKPTSSIFQPQQTVDLQKGEPATLELKGRHDPCIAIRAVPVVQACVRIVLADLLLLGRQEGLA